MAVLQKSIISVLLVLTIAFIYLAQASEAAKGPKITHKVCSNVSKRIGISRQCRSILILSTVMKSWER